MMGLELGLTSTAILAVVLSLLLVSCDASRGDQTILYKRCVNWHQTYNCSLDGRDFLPHNPATIWLRLTRWSCTDNCRYECMWITVKAFQDDGLPVPQFHGKWPFLRFYGIQEPASAIFSFLNFITQLGMTILFTKRVPMHAPMYRTWIAYALFSLNAWFSSTIFHMKDTPMTEKMDYFGALAYLLCSLYAFVARYVGPERRSILQCVVACMTLFFICHVSYLTFVKFDYKYNLFVNITIGVVNGLAWLYWCLPRRYEHPHNWNAVLVIVLLNILVALELFDFPPVWWIFDAHAIWHAGTILLAIPWFLFAIDDSLLMMKDETGSLESRKNV